MGLSLEHLRFPRHVWTREPERSSEKISTGLNSDSPVVDCDGNGIDACTMVESW